MARSYCIPANCTNTQSATNASVNIVATAAIQPNIFEINSGCDATPANQACKIQVVKITAVGTGQGAVTPTQINPFGGTAIASVTIVNQGASALDTYSTTVIFLQWAQNQNTAYRWVASSPQRMIGLVSTASTGAGFMPVVVTSAFNQVYGIFFEE